MTTEEQAMTTEEALTYPIRERRAVLSLTGRLIGIYHTAIASTRIQKKIVSLELTWFSCVAVLRSTSTITSIPL